MSYDILITMAADVARLQQSMSSANKVIADFARQTKQALGGVFAGLSAGVAIKQFVDAADSMKLMEARLRLVTKSEEELAKARADSYRIAQLNNVGLAETANLYTKLAGPVQRLGGSTKEVGGIVEAFAASLRVGGASTVEASAATLQFAQAMASGKLSGDEFRSLAEASPRFMQALAEGMGAPIENLKKMGSEGKLTADVVGNALLKQLTKLRTESASLPDTVGGAFTRLKNDALLMAEAIDKATGITETMAEALGTTSGIFAQFMEAVKQAGASNKQSAEDFDVMRLAMSAVGITLETLAVLFAEIGFIAKQVVGEIAVRWEQLKLYVTAMSAKTSAESEKAWAQLKKVGAEWEAQSQRSRTALDAFTSRVVGSTERVLQQREALKNHSLSSKENADDLNRLAHRAGALGGEYAKLAPRVKTLTEEEKKAAEAAAKLRAETLDKIAAMEMEDDTIEKMSAAQKLMLKIGEDIRDGKLRLTEAEKKEVYARLEVLDATQRLREEYKAISAAAIERGNAEKSAFDALTAGIAATKEDIEAAKQKTIALELEARGIKQTESAVLLLRAAKLDYLADTADEPGSAGLTAQRYREQAAALRELAGVTAKNEQLQAQIDVARATREEWKRVADDIEKALTDAMVNGFEGGKSFIKSIGDWIANYFKTTVASAIARGLAGTITSLASGLAQAAGSALFSSGGGAGGAGGVAGGSGGNLIGSLASGIGASGMFGAGLYGTLGTFGIGGGVGTLGALQAAGSLIGTSGGLGAGLSMGAGALAPYAAAAYGLYRVISGTGTGRDRAPAYQQYGIVGNQGLGYAGNTPNLAQGGAGYYNDLIKPAVDTVAAAVTTLGGKLTDLTYGIYTSTGSEGSGAYMRADVAGQQGAVWGVSSNGSNEDLQARINAAIPQMVLAGIQNSDLDERFKEYFASIDISSATLDSVNAAVAAATAVDQFSKSVSGLTDQLAAVATMSVQDVLDFGALFGGLDQARDAIGTYIDSFYGESEKFGMAMGAVQDQLAALGYAGVTTREGFREIVEGLDLTDESQAKTYAALMKLAPAFAAVTPPIVEAADAAGEATDATNGYAEAMRSAKDIANERAGLERRIMELTGDTAGLRALELASLDPTNRALQERVFALEDERAAAAQAQRVAEERYGLEGRLLELQGDTQALRDRELAKLDDSNKELQLRIWALEDEQAAAERAREALAKMFDAAGIDTGKISDLLRDGLLGRISQEDLGGQLGDMIVGGLQRALASQFADQIAGMFTDQIITPVLTAIMTGGEIASAISAGQIDAVVQKATQAAAAFSAILNSTDFQTALASIRTSIDNIVKSTSTLSTTATTLATTVSSIGGPGWGTPVDWGSLNEEQKLVTQIDQLKFSQQGITGRRFALDASSPDYEFDFANLTAQIEALNGPIADLEAQLARLRAGAEGGGGAIAQDADLLRLTAEYRSLEVALLRATGQEAAAVAKQREIDIEGLSAEAVAQYDLNAARRQQIAAAEAQRAKDQERFQTAQSMFAEGRQLEIEWIRLTQGEEAALAKTREFAIVGMDAELVAYYDANAATRALIESKRAEIAETERQAQSLKTLTNDGRQLEVEYLRAQGKDIEALALLREIETEGMTAQEIALYDLNAAKRVLIDSVLQQAAADRDAADAAQALADKRAATTADLTGQRDEAQIEVWRLEGKTIEANALARQRATEGLTAEQIIIFDSINALRARADALRAEQEITDSLNKDSASLAVELLRAEGKEQDANNLARSQAIVGMTAQQIAQWDLNESVRQSIKTLTEAAAVTTRLNEDKARLDIELLRAQGKESLALAAERALETEGMTEAQIALWESNRATRALIDTLREQAQVTAGLEADGQRLAVEELNARGKTAEALALQREIDIAGMTAEQIALYDTNAATRQRIAALNAEAAVADQRVSMEDRILQLQGKTDELRDRQLARLDPSLRGLQETIWNLEDAAGDVGDSIDDTAEKMRRVAEERAGLERRLLELQGDTNALRELDLQKLDASNRALQQQIWALEDAKAAQEELAQSLTEFFDMLQGHIDDLLGESGAGMSAAQGQSFIDAALSTAQATGVLPDTEALSKAIEAVRGGIDKDLYSTRVEADRARILLANQLTALQQIAGSQSAYINASGARDSTSLITGFIENTAGLGTDVVDALTGTTFEVEPSAEALSIEEKQYGALLAIYDAVSKREGGFGAWWGWYRRPQDELTGSSMARAQDRLETIMAEARDELRNMRAETQATAVASNRTARLLQRVTRDGESLLTTTAP